MDRFKKFFVCLLIIALISFFIFPKITRAAALTALSDTMSRLADSTPSAVYSDHTIRYITPSGVAAGQDMQITMPTGFTIGTVDFTDIDVSWGATTGYENELTLAATCVTTTWGAAFAGQVLTITSCTGTITSTNKVVIEIGNNASGGNAQIQNHATAATYTISIAGSFTDTGKIAIVILTDDQVSLTASVDPSITFSLSANSSAFGTLAPGVIDTADTNITLTVGTNAGTGYTITVRDSGGNGNPGLWNSVASAIIGSADASYNNTADLTAVSLGYGLQATCTAGCTTGTDIDARWRQGADTVGGLEITATTMVNYTTTLSANHTVQVVHKAKASTFTPAGSYADTLTYIATGNF
ncbi:MAG: Uncharacterized protein CEN92_272 [Candidatus Berkelbacteria bacterium Licking1014_96]|uniref:Uncharacterized protein n=1 Tax=Candidatus Berkelbacteria bacterium Licking1014_96 TaxID=2017149 RepID=A0A554LEZ9_9BACT|nr:MAG: Uncharacterized protein CEN92_272 [Candidatus Berkelbacteria bacterium Licking1014_96]